MARTAKDLAPILALAPKTSPWRPLKAKVGRRVLTDDYGNLIITHTWLRW
ncbi:MAG: hypothetical protein QGG19_00580 [Alphaproteobacteria bacterium]|jgi:hypothetical protein|nr:hypothetical protein [Alphaproteobacteria bacterium]MDP6255384.1 hypothetical protein [Alphaproteobacteria bacterium]MDP7053472.1 hypothetical protein [Alphaproteobacteria bacterium]MDP7229555.1 hypothetical protein [Alphaproteobacteria bacterium]MDP7459585.1 hypothetical protein [Alphaproteobacteria bacterium]|tara:strand:- start:3472 stop:3621 length:150 start_codon:yes stop_codon:yes gene_type:complete